MISLPPFNAQPFLAVQAELGECPLWDHRANTLYLVDIIRCRLIAFDWASKLKKEWPLPALGGGLALAQGGRLLVATQRGLFFFDPASGSYEHFVNPEPEAHFNRLNEGKCDSSGRFWIGSMSTIDRRASGKLYVIDSGGRIDTVLSDIVIPNTLTWANDNRRMLFADSWQKKIWSFDFDSRSGTVGKRRVFADLAGFPGIPDGIANDNSGGFWVAKFGEGCIVRFSADGTPTNEISLPVTQITSCVFAGPELDNLVIVSSKRLLTDKQRAEQTGAGDLYVVHPPFTGRRSYVFGEGASA